MPNCGFYRDCLGFGSVSSIAENEMDKKLEIKWELSIGRITNGPASLYMYGNMVVSQNRGPQYSPQNIIVLIMGTPNKVPPNFGKPPHRVPQIDLR